MRDPADYPWPSPARDGVLWPGGEVDAVEALDVEGRTPIVAVGSNASPVVLAGKLGELLATGMPIRAGTVEGLTIAHSAHVSLGGYVAAAPARGDGTSSITVCWCDEAQRAALDATEPNYRRVRLPETMPCRVHGVRVRGAEAYVSTHGVIGEHGVPLSLRSQAALLAWLGQRLPAVRDLLEHERLQQPDARECVRHALRDARLVVGSGL